MSHHPPSGHDTLPSALSSLFESPHHHFMPAQGDDDNILMENDLAAAAAATSHQSPAPESDDPDVDAAAAAATVLELAEADANANFKRGASQRRPIEKAYAPRNTGPLDVTLGSLAAENERLRKMIAALERRQTEDAISQATLRELAAAAVDGGPSMDFGLESLQQHLENHPRFEVPNGEPSDGITAADFIHGLVTQVTEDKPDRRSEDPLVVTARALEAEIAATRDMIKHWESSIFAKKYGVLSQRTIVDHKSQAAKNSSLLETTQKNVSVLRELMRVLQADHDQLQKEVSEKTTELKELLGDDADDVFLFDGQKALMEVRGYIEGALKLWNERGQLPPEPLPLLPTFIRPETLQPPPSSLPKKRGRPARSSQKPSVVPAQLAHLVPDPDAVRQREQETPIRRKGVKRGKHDLEKEKQREEEEGEMLRNLVGMGVFTREPGYVEDN